MPCLYVLIDGKPTVTCLTLAVTANGKAITTLEALASKASGMHPLQQALVEIGAIQCGYCTPAQILCATALLDQNQNPTEPEVRAAFTGVLYPLCEACQAVLRAAMVIRAEDGAFGKRRTQGTHGSFDSQALGYHF